MKTLSAEQFKSQYGDVQLNQPTQEPGYFERVGSSIKQTFTGLGQDLEKQAETIAGESLKDDPGRINQAVALGRGGLRTAGAVAKAAMTPLMEAPGIKQASEFVGGKIAETTPMQKFAEWASRHPEAAKDIENSLDIAGLLGTAKAAGPVIKGAKVGAEKIGQATMKAGQKIGLDVSKKVSATTKNVPSNLMNRIARLNPSQEQAFHKVTGMTPGEYLTKTGNFGTPEQIIAKEANKFSLSRSMVDDELAKLPGAYKVNPVDDALNLLSQKGIRTSTPGVKAPFAEKVGQLINKSRTEGLTMQEINEVKRLFEREIKLGYNKLNRPNLVEKATNIDSAIRKWQFKQAHDLGFKNIAELNKQTQVSKFLIDKLGDKIIGQSALNNITLTDWIMLSGGDPTAVGGFLTKKFFSSKAVQAKIAKILRGKGDIKDLITPEKDFTPAYLQQKALPSPSGEKPFGRIIGREPTSFEAQTPKGTITTTNPKTGDRYIRDVKTKQLRYEPKK